MQRKTDLKAATSTFLSLTLNAASWSLQYLQRDGSNFQQPFARADQESHADVFIEVRIMSSACFAELSHPMEADEHLPDEHAAYTIWYIPQNRGG